MSDLVSLRVLLNPSDLAFDLLQAGEFDIEKFILCIDEEIADEGFTIGLMEKLLESLLTGSEGYIEYLSTKALEQNFGDTSPTAEWPHPSYPMFMRNYAKELDEESEKLNKLKSIKKLLGSLVK
jgi:hypothetical protein